jgi:A/G-specific adenine glycosylase
MPLSRAALGRRLLAWFDRHQRDLPWRHTRDAYSIWVSEIMLQQTQVSTVAPRFTRFIHEFPTIGHLAAADEQTVLRCWEGLGYYRRARHLHAAARVLVERHGGVAPNDPKIWRDLPGIGRYTLGAILSQAFDRRLPILETNSTRLWCRFFGIERSPSIAAVRGELWLLAESLLPKRRAGDFNQAVMELGALICTPKLPRCTKCPLATECAARRLGRQASLPARPVPAKAERVQEIAVVVWKAQRVLLVQRQDDGRWPNMWEFPRSALEADESPHDGAHRIVRELTGIRAAPRHELATFKHTVTRYSISLICFDAAYESGKFRAGAYQQGIWMSPGDLSQFPLSSPQRRLARLLQPSLPSGAG